MLKTQQLLEKLLHEAETATENSVYDQRRSNLLVNYRETPSQIQIAEVPSPHSEQEKQSNTL